MDETAFYLQKNGVGVYDKVGRLCSPTGSLEILSKSASAEARSALKVGMFHDDVAGHLVCLFRLEGVLWLRIDDLLVPVDDDVHVHWEKWQLPSGWLRGRFRVTKADEEVYSLEYTPLGGWLWDPDGPPPHISEEVDEDYDEDSDFFLFVTNVLEKPGRRHGLFSKPHVF
jgi:hypothetical protein